MYEIMIKNAKNPIKAYTMNCPLYDVVSSSSSAPLPTLSMYN